ncbi:MAG: phosphotransacetylase family protein [Candidatus Bathyarchaeia archaeon]|nr:phosphotransacetylase family protein [Candidatus Bathyarchaeota archaeon]
MVKRAIYVASTDELSGKSAIIIALTFIAKEMGKRAGYFKPIGFSSSLIPGREQTDEDVEIIRSILNSGHESSVICPIVLRRSEFLEDFIRIDLKTCIESVRGSYEKISRDVDLMFIEGPPTFSAGAFLGCSIPKLAKEFNAEILLVERAEEDSVVDDILQIQDCCIKWGTRLFGVVLNRIPQDRMERTERVIKSFIERNGVEVLGLIPEDKMLSAPTVREICDFIGGRVLAGGGGLDRVVEAILIGAMTPESAVKYFRKISNEIVITGGDRTDIILTALETDVAAIILTGNLYPSAKVFPKADALNIPLILVPYDTYTTLQHVQKVIGRIKPKDSRRINAAVDLVKRNVNYMKILAI